MKNSIKNQPWNVKFHCSVFYVSWNKNTFLRKMYPINCILLVLLLLESAKLRALRAYVVMYQCALRAYLLVPQCALRAFLLTCQPALRALRAYVSRCSRAITTNNKYKFFNNLFCLHFCDCSFFFLWKKTTLHSCITLVSRKPLTGAMTNFVQ